MTEPRAPIPRKPNPALLGQAAASTPVSPAMTPAPSSPRLPSLLDALLEDCVLQSLDATLLCAPRADYVKQFHRFLRDRHCHENLSFLIEVFRYKYYYDKIGPTAAESAHALFKPSFLDQLLEHSVENLSLLPLTIRRAARSISHSRSNSVANLGVTLPFPFELDDDDATPSSTSAWNALKDGYLSSDNSSLASAESESSCTSSEKAALLHDQWAMILERFIEPNAPEQVNICAATAHRVMDVDPARLVHPSVLEAAKIEAIDLLRENAYNAFLAAAAVPTCVCHAAMSQSHSPKPVLVSRGLVSGLRVPSSSVVPLASLEPRTNRSGAASPSPHHKRRHKLLSQLSGSFDDVSNSSGSSLSLSGIIHHFKHHSRTNTASPHLMPASGLKTVSPVSHTDDLGSHALTPRDSTLSPTFLDKLLKKKRSP